MTWLDMAPVEAACYFGMIGLSLSICLCFIRLARGPMLADRVVALDTAATLLVGLLVLSGILDMQAGAIRIATLLALTNFVGTIAFAIQIRRKGTPE